MFVKPTTKSYVIFSPLKGVLVQNGKPLPYTKIIRRLRWNGNEGGLISEFFTDAEGRFNLPIHEENLTLGLLDTFVSNAQIDVLINDNVYELWYSNKFEEHIYAETKVPVEGLVCDIEGVETAVHLGVTTILSRCRWDDMPKSEDEDFYEN